VSEEFARVGRVVQDANLMTEERVYEVLKRLAVRDDRLVGMTDLCRVLGADPDVVERIVRSLEERGAVLCAPHTSPAAVVALVAPLDLRSHCGLVQQGPERLKA
jgi:hypothetical protein